MASVPGKGARQVLEEKHLGRQSQVQNYGDGGAIIGTPTESMG